MVIKSKNGNFQFNCRSKEFEIASGRREFFDETIKRFACESGENICHRLSFQSMKHIILHSLNNDLTSLCNLIETILHGKAYDEEACCIYIDETDTYQQDLYQEAMNCLGNIKALARKNENNASTVLNNIEDILSYLNNSPMNLRIGNGAWNRSIGCGYDPVAWEPTEEGFLLTDWYDCFIMSLIFHNPTYLPSDEPISIFTCKYDGNIIVYSSNNDGFVNIEEVEICPGIRIYYDYYDVDGSFNLAGRGEFTTDENVLNIIQSSSAE